MGKQIRFAIDMDVPNGDPEVVAKAIFDARESIGDFVASVVIPNNEATEGLRTKVLAGGSHIHSTDDGYCAMCDRYSRAETLIEI